MELTDCNDSHVQLKCFITAPLPSSKLDGQFPHFQYGGLNSRPRANPVSKWPISIQYLALICERIESNSQGHWTLIPKMEDGRNKMATAWFDLRINHRATINKLCWIWIDIIYWIPGEPVQVVFEVLKHCRFNGAMKAAFVLHIRNMTITEIQVAVSDVMLLTS